MTMATEQLAARAALRPVRTVFDRLYNTPMYRMQRRQMMLARRFEIFTLTSRLHVTEYKTIDYMVRRPGRSSWRREPARHMATAPALAFDNPKVRAAQQRLNRTLMSSRMPPTLPSGAALDRVRDVFSLVISRRLTEAAYWLPDDVDPYQPATVTGLDDKLPADRARNLAGIVHLNDYRRALLHYSHRRAAEPPGKIVTARPRRTRGPNTRWTTSLTSRLAGFARA